MKPNCRKKSNGHKKKFRTQKNYNGYPPRQEGQNYHHVLPQSQYTTDYEHKLGRHKGLVIPEFIPVHDYLTKTVPFPPKFLYNEIGDCLQFLKQSSERDNTGNRFWGVEAVMRYTVFLEMDNEEASERAHDIRWNLAQQIGVMAGQHTVDNPITNHANVIDPQKKMP